MNINTRVKLKAAIVLMLLSALAACGGGGGENGSSGVTPAGNSNAVVLRGQLAVVAQDPTTNYTVFNANRVSVPSSSGVFSTAVSKDKPTYTFAVANGGGKIYAAISTSKDSAVAINAQSTAESLVLLSPLLLTESADEQARIAEIAKSDPAVKALAATIEGVYSAVADPLSDPRITSALTKAAASVLTTWQESNSVSSVMLRQATSSQALLARSSILATSSSMHIRNNDMGVLSTAGSTGNTLKLSLNNTGPLGGTTNVDWLVRVVELDSTRIQWNSLGAPILGSPTYITDVDSLIKVGGFNQVTIVQGAVAASGVLAFASDPIGAALSDIVMTSGDITLPHDGVYAVVALSGSPFGDADEYQSVQQSAWQAPEARRALAVNVTAIAVDVLARLIEGVTGRTGAPIDISDELKVIIAAAETKVTANPSYVTTAHIIGMVGESVGTLLDYLKPYFFASLTDIQSSALKKFLGAAVGAAKNVVDVYSTTLSVGTRVADFVSNVTPRESAYVLLGGAPIEVDAVAPTTPSGVMVTAISASQIDIAWNASTDNIGVTGYKLYRSGQFIANQTVLVSSDVGLNAATQYCYAVSAIDGAGNESPTSAAQCATTGAVGTMAAAPSAPTGVSVSAGEGQVTISWNAGPGSYNLYFASIAGVSKNNYTSLPGGAKITGVSSPHTQSGLTNGTPYYFVVTAVNANGESGESSQVLATPKAAIPVGEAVPATPTTLSPGASSSPGPTLSSSALSVSWSAVGGAARYVGGITDIAAASDVVTIDTTGTSATASLSPGKQYRWYLYACNSAGCSKSTALYYFQTPAPAPTMPAAPTALTPGATSSPGPTASSSAVSLSWGPVNGATVYTGGITDLAAGADAATINTSGTSTTATLSPGKQYRWYLYACNSAGCSASSAMYYFQTPAPLPSIPATPTTLTPGSAASPGPTLSGSAVSLSWNAVSGATRYVGGITDISTGSDVATIDTTSTTTSATLAPGKQYRWYLFACNSAGCSSSSVFYYFQTPTLAPTIPVTPTSLTPGSPGSPGPTLSSTAVAVSWNAIAGATRYIGGITDIGAGHDVVTIDTTGTSASATLNPSKQYRWYVFACNSGGCSSSSALYYFQTPAAASVIPGPPTGLTPGSTSSPGPTLSSRAVSVSWTAVSGATLYIGGITDIGAGKDVATINTSGTSAVATLSSGRPYRWYVYACGSAGCSASSAPYYFRTP